MLDPTAFVLSMNAARRHLTGDQVIALYMQANAVTIEAEKAAGRVTQQANLKKGPARPEGSTVSPSGKTAARIGKALGKSASAVKRVQRVQKVAPERMPEVVRGEISAARVLKKVAPTKAKDPAKAEQAMAKGEAPAISVEDNYLTEIGEGRPVDSVAIRATQEAVRKLLDALETIAPRWVCSACNHTLAPGEEPEPKWECGNEGCGETWVGLPGVRRR
jgi:hypothetical protein